MKRWCKIVLAIVGMIVFFVIGIVLFHAMYSPTYGFKVYSPSKPSSCFFCGGKVATICYGLYRIDEELEEQIGEGEVVLGGCIVREDSPDWECSTCGQNYWRAWKCLHKVEPTFSFQLKDVLEEEDEQ